MDVEIKVEKFIVQAVKLSIDRRTCIDELHVMQTLRRTAFRDELEKLERRVYFEWALSKSQPQESYPVIISSEESKILREGGNRIMNSKSKTFKDCLQASNIYTQAIFSAPIPLSSMMDSDSFSQRPNKFVGPLRRNEGIDDKGKTLALAYANRAYAFQECGYYAEAYGDCTCALRYGYPQKMRHKIVTRQAYCAWKLGIREHLEKHLAKLQEFNLNENFQRQKQELGKALETLREGELIGQTRDLLTALSINGDSGISQIKVEMSAKRGRCMLAKQPIKKNDLIFSESVSEFLAVDNASICHHCARQVMVPYPCSACYGRVFYCSPQCQAAHQGLHSFECLGYQYGIFERVGIGHLALRMLLHGLPQVAPHFKHCETSRELWAELNKFGTSCDAFEGEKSTSSCKYFQTLSLMTSFEQMAFSAIVEFAAMANKLCWYLCECTNFLDGLIGGAKATRSEWKIVIASLLMRHIGQAILNAHGFHSLTFVTREPFAMLDSSLWASCNRLSCGFLHKLRICKMIASANAPLLSICNHRCSASLCQYFCQGQLKAYASRNIAENEEIFNGYVLDYRVISKEERHKQLESIYGFKCDCPECVSSKDPDEALLQFHQYRCSNAECQNVFVPPLSDLHWWMELKENETYKPGLKCSKCQKLLDSHWYEDYVMVLNEIRNASGDFRPRALKFIEQIDGFVVGYNQFKIDFALDIMEQCFSSIEYDIGTSDDEFHGLAEIIRFVLKGIALRNDPNSLTYIATMTYLWDLIAMQKTQASRIEFEPMLNATAFLSKELRLLFENYYEDYIKNVLK